MTFLQRASGYPKSVAILAGAFNPPTNAHIALSDAALSVVDEVLFVVPRALPHKEYHGASLEQRGAMLQRIASSRPRLSAAIADGGLFAEIAREARPYYPGAEVHLLCGRDAAERILTWDYGDPAFVDTMLREFRLLVAPREGDFHVEDRFVDRVRVLPLQTTFDECSSTRLREARRGGGDWRALAPPQIHDLIDAIYASPGSTSQA